MKTLLRLVVPVVILTAVVAAVSLTGGCGSKTPSPAPTTVRGTLTFNDVPVEGGLVVFTPDPQRGGSGKPAHGVTAADGSFSLALGNSTEIPPGWYRVSLAASPGRRDSRSASLSFPTKLARPDMSGIEREVLVGHNHVFAFAVEVPTN